MNAPYASLPPEVPARLAQGSQLLTYNQLYLGANPSEWLFQEPECTIAGEPCGPEGLLTELIKRIDNRKAEDGPIFIVGKPGIGKTSLAFALVSLLNLRGMPTEAGSPEVQSRWMWKSRRAAVNGKPGDGRVPRAAVIDLKQYLGEYEERPQYFGTALWMRSAGPAATDKSRIREGPLVILDALDEVVGPSPTLHSIEELLRRALFRDAVASVCSDELYRRIASLGVVRSALVVELFGLPLPRRLEFARRYARVLTSSPLPSLERGQDIPIRTFGEEASRAIRRDAHGGSGTYQEPLHLIIMLERLRRGGGSLRPHLDFYVSTTLDREVASGARRLTQDKILNLLGRLSSLLQPFEPGVVPSSANLPSLTASAYAHFVQGAAADIGLSPVELLEELAHCRFSSVSPGQVGLTGRQFRDYFLAHHIARAIIGDAPRGAIFQRFARLLPGAVVAHLVDQLRCLQPSEELRTLAIARLWHALESAVRPSDVSPEDPLLDRTDPHHHRVARQQLGYYLGITIGPGREGGALLQLLDDEPLLGQDPWVRRGVVVGLGMGGRDGVISSYVNELWGERYLHDERCADDCEIGFRRRVNVEFNLVLFGDAPPKDGKPDRCDYPNGCAGAITGMIDLLETERNVELKRLVLFIILDLHDYHWDGDPKKNLAQVWENSLSEDTTSEVQEREGPAVARDVHWNLRDRLYSVLDALDDDEKEWPEASALRALMARLPRQRREMPARSRA